MGEPQTWQAFLGVIVDDPQERLRIARAIGVNQITLARWATGISSPRLRSLRLLLDVLLPEQRERFLELLAEEYPDLLQGDRLAEEELLQIPSRFYARVLETYTSYPAILRGALLGSIILQQMLEQLDPQQTGLGIFIAKCMPPSSNKVRSTRTIVARGSGIWRKIEERVLFHGIESQVGHATQEQRLILTQSREERENWYPPPIPGAQSVAAFPIQLADRVAGGISLLSVHAEFFSLERLDLLRAYAGLLVLIFEQNEFYVSNQIEMGVLPSSESQQTLLATFQQRVKQRILEATRKQQLLLHLQAEMEVWQEMEDTLLHLSQST
jgi:hypothetical protein